MDCRVPLPRWGMRQLVPLIVITRQRIVWARHRGRLIRPWNGPMSVVGQNRKSSMRAYDFRCSPNNGHRQDTSACPFRASFGRRTLAHDCVNPGNGEAILRKTRSVGDRRYRLPVVRRGEAINSSTCVPNFAWHPQSGRGRDPSRSARTQPAGDSSNRTAAPQRHSALAS